MAGGYNSSMDDDWATSGTYLGAPAKRREYPTPRELERRIDALEERIKKLEKPKKKRK